MLSVLFKTYRVKPFVRDRRATETGNKIDTDQTDRSQATKLRKMEDTWTELENSNSDLPLS